MIDPAPYRALVSELLRGRKLILALGPLAAMKGHVQLVRELGAERPLLLCDGVGTGEVPSPDDAEAHVLENNAPDMMGGIRAYNAALANLSPEILAAIDRYDPRREALVLSTFLVHLDQVAGRPRYAPPLAAWRALEDKVVIDAFFERAGLPLAPWRIVPARLDEMREAASILDEGAGTVWAGDAREGFNGGASYVRWVQDGAQAEAAAEFFAQRCDRARVMPFLDGIPCSIHGVVFPDSVAVFRPCEMLVLRRPGDARFQYCGVASTWDPPEADRAQMRALARQVGARLRAEVGYRGAFTIDGVMTGRGFRPTELNPRVGAALLMLGGAVPELPLWFVLQRVQAGDPIDLRAEVMEAELLEVFDAHRVARAHTHVHSPRPDQIALPIRWQADRFVAASEGEPTDGQLLWGPSTAGSFLRLMHEDAKLPVGSSFAPRVEAAFSLADAVWGCGIGPLEPAPELRATGAVPGAVAAG